MKGYTWSDKNGYNLSNGDKVIHDDGGIETIVVYGGEYYIDGEIKSVFPLSEFPYKFIMGNHILTEFTIVK